MFTAMPIAAFRGGYNGIPIRYRFDWKLFNLRVALRGARQVPLC